MIQERLAALRGEMRKRGITIYLIPTADCHESEYVGEHFKAREYISGFTGSAGTAVVTMEEAGLWTDARYFVQAAMQLEGSGFTLYRMQEEGVPTVTEYLGKALGEGGILGFDGRMIHAKLGEELREIAAKKQASIHADEDLVGLIWEGRPPLSCKPAWKLEERYSGRTTEYKLAQVRSQMEEKEADLFLLTSLYDIAWLLNVRGDDISYVPVVLSYLALSQDQCIWFVQEEAVPKELRGELDGCGIEVRPYDSLYEYVGSLPSDRTVLLDKRIINDRICSCLPEGIRIIDEENPTEKLKAVKNAVELANVRVAHQKDAAAMIRFMFWLKKNIGRLPMTEISASDYLEGLRREQEGFLEQSFETICGYAEHGAIVHYEAVPETDAVLRSEGFLLVDSGGHYLEGTTDITRTFALGPLTMEMKENYTRVCRSNLALANARFLRGCSGRNLDILAREPFWEAGLDFKHGTGHGVGYVLNVHEGPNSFRWQKNTNGEEDCALEAGMITTDEPGLYLEGKYGIRLENELVCCEGEKNEYGQFLYFENLTYVPFDLDAILPEQMSLKERGWLNAYHAMVFETMSPFFEGELLDFLREATREI